jgi:hypothetical protein
VGRANVVCALSLEGLELRPEDIAAAAEDAVSDLAQLSSLLVQGAGEV